jgi:hypothetical protein
MVVQGIVIILSIFIFLFTLYALSREDFVFLRKNISLIEAFDVAWIVLLAALLSSRLLYVIFHFDKTYLNPLVFFLIPYFPGLSLIGAVLGALLSLMIITKRHKYPRGRFFDFFSFAFLSVLPLSSIASFLSDNEPWFFAALPFLYYTLLLIFFLRILLPRFLQGQMRDGMMGSLILMNYSLFSSIMEIITAINMNISPLTPQLGIFLSLFIVSFFFYLRQGLAVSLRR